MRVLIATTGSDGDVRPFFPLGRELAARGHDVLFSASDHYGSSVAEQGLAFRKIGPPWIRKDAEESFRRVLVARSPLAGLFGDPALDAFMGDERPVVIGFGSMVGFDLRSRIERMYEDARMQESARALADAIGRETGVVTAANLIERTVSREGSAD